MLNELFSDRFAQRRNYLTEVDARVKILFVAAAMAIVVSSRYPYVPLMAFFLSLAFLLRAKVPAGIILLRAAAPLGMACVIFFV